MGSNNKRHGGTVRGVRSPTYITWQSMLLRCYNPSTNGFENYGGRGIKVCPEWHEFSRFLADMGERPDGLTLDRIDTDDDYRPGNCRWATLSTQKRNMRNAAIIEFNGESHTAAEWGRILGTHRNNILRRFKRGAPISG